MRCSFKNARVPDVSAPSSVLSLEDENEVARMLPSFARGPIVTARTSAQASRVSGASLLNGFRRRSRDVTVHRLRETINGREYLIEVSNIGSDKWRAQIARVPGGSAALMPFYGKTPDEAAGQLSNWLEIAHGVKRC
jgi:hypothetical protein